MAWEDERKRAFWHDKYCKWFEIHAEKDPQYDPHSMIAKKSSDGHHTRYNANEERIRFRHRKKEKIADGKEAKAGKKWKSTLVCQCYVSKNSASNIRRKSCG